MEYPLHDTKKWDLVLDLRDDINKQLELARNDKLIGASLEAAAYIHVQDSEKLQILSQMQHDESIISPPVKTNGVDDLRTTLMISQVYLKTDTNDLRLKCNEKYVATGKETSFEIGVTKAKGSKCARCWFYDELIPKGGPRTDLCQRCNQALSLWELETNQTFLVEDGGRSPRV